MSQQEFSFSSLSQPLQKALAAMNIKEPTPIQQQAIPAMLEGHDLIALAKTGTGKTAAFALPILERLTASTKLPQALILAPTRELAIQVAEQVKSLSAYHQRLTIATLCGGQSYTPQLRDLERGADVVVGTPGRILDHLERGSLKLGALNTLILDEADEMLRMGFIEDVETILARLGDHCQIGLFSATMPAPIRKIAVTYLDNPVTVEIKSATATVDTINQKFLFATQHEKPEALSRILAVEEYQGVIVFVRTKSATEEVAEKLVEQGIRAVALHGDIAQNFRERITQQFRSGLADVLVATDVAARGLDVERVSHVINYDIPSDCETYVHRIGRTGRAGRSGVSILFVTPREARMLSMIERFTKKTVEKIRVPSDEQLNEVREQRFHAAISARLEHQELPAYQQLLKTYLKNNPHVQPEQAAAVLALMQHQDKPWAIKSTQKFSDKPFKREREEQRGEARFEKKGARKTFVEDGEVFRIDVGRLHGARPGNIVGAIANEAGIPGKKITGLTIRDEYSTVCLPRGLSKAALANITKAWVCGRQLNIKPVQRDRG